MSPRMSITRQCELCDADYHPFYPTPTQPVQKFCSPACYRTARFGASLTSARIDGQSIAIKLHGGRGGEALIDDGLPMMDWIMNQRWYQGENGYVVTNIPTVGDLRSQVYLHRMVTGCVKGDGVHVDHRDHNKLDNRSANLRAGTRAENMQNQNSHVGAVSAFCGVWLNTCGYGKGDGQWFGDRKVNGVKTRVGPYATEREAFDALEAAS